MRMHIMIPRMIDSASAIYATLHSQVSAMSQMHALYPVVHKNEVGCRDGTVPKPPVQGKDGNTIIYNPNPTTFVFGKKGNSC